MLNHSIEFLLWQMPGYVAWKDTNAVYLGCNKNIAHLLGFNSIDSVVGITDYDLPCEAANSASKFISQDKKAIAGQPQFILDSHHYANGEQLTVITEKKQLCDQQGNVVGVVSNSMPITSRILTKIRQKLFEHDAIMLQTTNPNPQYSYTLGGAYADHQLTRRESECLFYLLRGKTARITATILGISQKTVASYLENIKTKFQCQSKSELIHYALEKGFLNSIPNSLLSKDLPNTLES